MMHRVLLVDDEDAVREVLERFLLKVGFEVIAASSGKEALDLVASGAAFDVAVLDIKMPKMSGLVCLKEMRKLRPGVRVILLTGSIDWAKHLRDLRELGYGIEDVLQKPIDLFELKNSIEEIIRE
jgi:two-component system, cell cycle sensor histidine kinase and response regulator CckA